MQVESGRTYVDIVEDNDDPKKLGRVKIRVLDVYDNTPIEDIPFANPWKDLNGNQSNIPDNGKVVTVVFENGNENNPEFISSDHYNINLEKKLKDLGKGDYLSMKSLIFDHKTQVYVNEGEGLKLDHKFNLINIKESCINVALKDNFGKINLGCANSNQRAILGDNFLNWMDDFVNILMGGQGGPFLGNMGAPVQATPALLANLEQYQSLKDPKFLSKNVNIVDNDNVDKLDRIAEGQIGDTWQSTVVDNKITSKEIVPFTPTAGSTDTTFDQPPIDAATQSSNQTEPIKPNPVQNPDVDVLIELLNMKSYTLYSEVNKLNIISIRNQCLLSGDKYSDGFVDKVYLLFKKEDNTWDLKQYSFSTVPGVEFTVTDNWLEDKNLSTKKEWIDLKGKKISMKDYAKIMGTSGDPVFKNGLPILVPSQYIDLYYISQYRGAKSMKIINGASQYVWRDKDTDNFDTFSPSNLTTPELIKPNELVDNGIKIHLGYPGGKKVGNWSEGSQVFASSDELNDFFNYCEKHRDKYDNKFTYTLATKKDWTEALNNISANKSVVATQSTVNQSTLSATQSVSPTQSTVSENPNASEYIIAILNPTTEGSKKISGKITFKTLGPKKGAIGELSGFPDGGTIGPLDGEFNSSSQITSDQLANEMIRTLEDSIIQKYNVSIKLVIVEKR